MESYILKVENLYKSFQGKSGHFWEDKIQVLKGLNFELEKGKITGFLGANGAGKTTFLKILFNFIKYDSGSIKFSKDMGDNFIEIVSKIGYLPERPFFHQHLTGYAFLSYMGSLNKINANDLSRSIDKWAPRLKIDHALDRELKFYSKGMLQRIGFLSALVHDPDFIVLDEPLSGIDPLGRKELKDIMRLVKQEGKTVFFSSHIVSDVEEVSDNVIFLKDGVIEYADSVEKLIKDRSIKDSYIVKVSDDKSVYDRECSGDIVNILKDLKEQNLNILEVKQNKKSLEEIFYISNVENNE
jgi:ABC-2 type transport system ATP-binding protein